MLLSALFLGEPLTALKAAAVSCGLAGAALIVLQGLGPGSPALALSFRR